jgi:endonuclease YncB( thermonuclease family)
MNLLTSIVNPLMKLVLHSPLHGLVSGTTMLVSFSGRMSGKHYTVPVNYTRDGDVITFFSHRARIWWRNLSRGAPVTVRVKGHDLPGTADVVTDTEQIVAGLAVHLAQLPGDAKYYQVRLDDDRHPDPQDVARAAETRALVRIKLG